MTGGSVRLVGLIGWPVEHSVSPAMHNAAFENLGLPWRYTPPASPICPWPTWTSWLTPHFWVCDPKRLLHPGPRCCRCLPT